MITRNRYFLLFFVINALIISIFTFFWFRHLAAELSYLRTLIRIQESKLAIKERNFLHYEENSLILAGLEQNSKLQQFIPYSQQTEVLSDISAAAKRYGLKEQHFQTAISIEYEDFLYIKITLQYNGGYADFLRFIESLVETPCNIDQLSIRTDPAEGTLWAWLSLYVIED
jgi:hypothetical protein